jgi:hypothetical protein
MQQFLMENSPKCCMAQRFREAPYRQNYYDMIEQVAEQDKRGELRPLDNPHLGQDIGVEARRARRSWIWGLKREIAYFDTKYGFMTTFQPICFYALALTMTYSVRGPFGFDLTWNDFSDMFFRIWIVFAYWFSTAIATFLKNSYQISDPNNPSNNVWRDQEDMYTFTWIKILGSWEGAKAVWTGRQPVWLSKQKSKLGVSTQTLIFDLPMLLAFFVILGSVIGVLTSWIRDHNEHAWEGVTLGRVLGCQIMSCFVILNLWPGTSCIIAELTGCYPYQVRGFFSALLACIVQVAAAVAWVLMYGSFSGEPKPAANVLI